MLTLFTVGYNAWIPSQRIQLMGNALQDAGVTLLVDVRHSPCASDHLGKTKTYGPKPWSLAAKGGILSCRAFGLSDRLRLGARSWAILRRTTRQ